MEQDILTKLSLGVTWYGVFLFSLVIHEAAHALAGKSGGDETAAREGLVTINPVPHMRREPLGTMVVPVISYALFGWMMGWGSAPYNPAWADLHPHRAARMSLAGPAANLLLAIISGTLISVGLKLGWFLMPDDFHYYALFSGLVKAGPMMPGVIPVLLSITFTLNFLLFVFNLIPLPPLDGSSAIGLLMSESGARSLQSIISLPQFNILGIIVAWKIIDFIFIPLYDFSIDLLWDLSYSLALGALFIFTCIPIIIFVAIYSKMRDRRPSKIKEILGPLSEEDDFWRPSPDTQTMTELFDAVYTGNLDKVQQMVDSNPGIVYSRDSEGAEALHHSAAGGHMEMLRFLLSRRPDINSRDNRGATPLHYAVLNGHLETAGLLMTRGAKVNARTNEEEATPLHCASVTGSLDLARDLLDRGADVNSRKADRQTPLHRAASRGYREIAGLLIERGAEIDAKDGEGRTPLMLAKTGGHGETADFLVSKGAEQG